MSKSTRKRLSLKPSEAEKGGSFGFPNGGKVTITEAKFGTWEEAGEKALKGGRKADDPALIITGDVDGADDPVTEFIGAGKANRSQPSDDGEFLEVAEGSAAVAVNDNSSTNIFLTSLCDKKKQGKMVLDEDDLDNGISKFLVGLVFVAGRMIPKREGDNLDAEGREVKLKPVLVAEEVIKKPSGEGSGGKKSKRAAADDEEEDAKPKRRKPAEDDEEEAAPKKKKVAKEVEVEESDDEDTEAQAEKLVEEVLGLPKYRKGLPKDDAFAAIYTQAKANDVPVAARKEIMALVEDDKWMASKKRSWSIDDDGDYQAGE